MKRTSSGSVIALAGAICILAAGAVLAADNAQELVREAIRQQSAAQRSGCLGVQRTLAAGSDASLVVRTAIEMGYNPCQVIRCALEGKADAERAVLCDKVIRGAAQAGAQPDVISRCSGEYCDPVAVAAILGDAFLETNYCYFAAQPQTAPEPVLLESTAVKRGSQEYQASTFRF